MSGTGEAARGGAAGGSELAAEVDDGGLAGNGWIEAAEAEVAVEAEGAGVGRHHGEVHARGPGPRRGGVERLHQGAAVTAALERGQQVDVQVRGIGLEAWPQ